MVSLLVTTSLVLMVLALLLNGIRLVLGPSDFDRLLAAETVALGLIGLLLLQANGLEDRFYVDAGLLGDLEMQLETVDANGGGDPCC